MDFQEPFDQTTALLPLKHREIAYLMPAAKKAVAEELRIRVGQPLSVTFPDGEQVFPDTPEFSTDDLRSVLEIATRASIHTALERVRNGFITVQGGHRIGLCGSAVIKDGSIYNFNHLSSLNIRIARQISGIADPLVRQMCADGIKDSVLVLAPPGAGKTTLLRDMIRGLSSGTGGKAVRVGVVDERSELAAIDNGIPQMDLGTHTDIIDGCSKAEGLMILLRGMNPQVMAVDEITAPQDIDAMEVASGCGVVLLATAHGSSPADLKRRPLYAALLERRIFQKAVVIESVCGIRQYRWEDITC